MRNSLLIILAFMVLPWTCEGKENAANRKDARAGVVTAHSRGLHGYIGYSASRPAGPCQLRGRTIAGVSEELRHVWRADEAILRKRIVVRTVIRMAPVVHAVGDGLDQLSSQKGRTTLRSQDA